jgi:hypothetical protein
VEIGEISPKKEKKKTLKNFQVKAEILVGFRVPGLGFEP